MHAPTNVFPHYYVITQAAVGDSGESTTNLPPGSGGFDEDRYNSFSISMVVVGDKWELELFNVQIPKH